MSTPLGLYQPGTSPLHRLSPGPKLVGLFLLAIAVLVTKGPWTGVGFVLLTIALAALGSLSPGSVLRALRPFLVVAVLLLAFNAWQNGWPRAVEVVADLTALILAATVLTATTAVNDLLDTIVRSLGPFRRLGVDPDRVGLTFSLMLRALPGTIELAAETRDAARARGLDRSIRARTIPLVLRVVARARDTGDALHARGVLD
ncbi:energy-coupling factor transporter transmembrane component T family protein [Aeromicrobium choanae]|uniref:Biotin transport system permease protein n=1 Tax=Aeromicrobium choanae TaxID=1736691 RepID=A0A1T4YXT6_9ACTN|nr:energy-coupling factor transporter transmembrane protein EcfT [Aeromicrobium choanae]SKB06600.1 biotin transport system permease protein [Aeromicrobium choanae]